MAIDKHAEADQRISEKLGIKRSPAWPEVEKQFRTAHPKCAACDETSQLNVHHKFPFHYVVDCGRPDLELDPRNLLTLCTRPDREHHLLLGHLDDYESYNPEVLAFVKTYANNTVQQIRNAAAFQKAHGLRPKHLDLMSAAEKAAFKNELDRQFVPDPAIVAKAAKARNAAQ